MASKLKTYTASDNLDFADWNAEFDSVYSALNGGSSVTIADGSVTQVKLSDDANSAVFFAELFKDGAVTTLTGFGYLSKTGLNVTIRSGTAYVLQTSTTPDKLIRINEASNKTYTVLDNTTNYLDLGADGVMDVTQSSTVAADHIRLLKVIASGAAITGTPSDEADRTFPDNAGTTNYFTGIGIEVTSTTLATIATGLSCRDTTDKFNISTSAAITLNIAGSVGALGLDQGSEGSSTWYAIVVIADSTGVVAESAVLVAASDYPASIVLPSGYDIYRRVGWVYNSSGSDFLLGKQDGGRFGFDDEITLETAFDNASFTSIPCTDAAPTTASHISLGIYFNGGHAVDQDFYVARVGVTGSSGGVNLGRLQNNNSSGTTSGKLLVTAHWIPLDSSQAFMGRDTGSDIDIIYAGGYQDKLED